MNTPLQENYQAFYSPLWKEFTKKLQGVNVQNCPSPHLPVYGTSYETTKFKLAFVGIDTKDSSDLHKFINGDVDAILNSWIYDFGDDIGYCSWAWRYNFWKFIFKFLSKFYNVDSEKLKERTEQNIIEILQSFIWANVHSIERFEVTARGKGVEFDNWDKVKKASLVFDKAYNILHVFKPTVTIVTYKHASEKWFTDSIKEFEGPETLSENLRYYFIKDTNSHIFWTKHPQSLNRSRASDAVIKEILQAIVSKDIFPSFPGKILL